METHVIQPIQSHTHTIIFLHPFNSNGSTFAEELFQASQDLDLQRIFPHLKWVFPSSPLRQSVRCAKSLPQWFDLWCHSVPNLNSTIQKPGLITSAVDILRIINMECASVSLDHIILAGIGQGCAAAVFVLLCGGLRLGSFIGISGWLPFANQMVQANKVAVSHGYDFLLNSHSHLLFIQATQSLSIPGSQWPDFSVRHTPIFLAHSETDILVPFSHGKFMFDALVSFGFNVQQRKYEERACWYQAPQVMYDLAAFIAKSMYL